MGGYDEQRWPARVGLGLWRYVRSAGAGGHLDLGRRRRLEPRSEQPALARGVVNAVVPTASGLVAIGATYDWDGTETASGWASRDGRSWSRTLLRNGAGYRGLRLALVPGGLLAIGSQYQGNNTTSRTWTTTDGSGWTRLRGADLEAETPGLAGTTADVFAIGRTSGSQPGDSKVWRLRLD